MLTFGTWDVKTTVIHVYTTEHNFVNNRQIGDESEGRITELYPTGLLFFVLKHGFVQIRGGLEETRLPLPGLRAHDPLCARRSLPMPSCRGTSRCQVSAGTISATCRCRCTLSRTGRTARPGPHASSGVIAPQSRSGPGIPEGKTPAPGRPCLRALP